MTSVCSKYGKRLNSFITALATLKTVAYAVNRNKRKTLESRQTNPSRHMTTCAHWELMT